MTRASAFDVAIIGGGASGALLAIQLLRKKPPIPRILLVDRAGDFARGIAYRTEEACHILNVPAERMSAFADEDEHFLAWLRRHDPSAGPGTFAPRRRYGDYLSELLLQTEHLAPGALERRTAEVRDLEDTSEGVRLHLAPGGLALARRAVLALGNFPPQPLHLAPQSDARVWQSPWPRQAPWPPPDARVLLVGAGLTAIDVLLSLAARGHRGPWHVLSRHGLLPNEHLAVPLAPLELELPRRRILPLLQALRAAAARPGADWRPVVDSVRRPAQGLWRSLASNERERFNRHARTYWEVHRHRIAPAVGEQVRGFLKTGQLQLHAGRLLTLLASSSGLEATFRPRGTQRQDRLLVDLAVNCTGPAGHAANPDGLVSALLRRGLARPGPLGLGLATDSRGGLLDEQGRASGGLWTLGPVRRGEDWESTAIPDIRIQAAELAGLLVAERGAAGAG